MAVWGFAGGPQRLEPVISGPSLFVGGRESSAIRESYGIARAFPRARFSINIFEWHL
jgi:hypothetical protein